MVAEELEAAGLVGRAQHLQKQPAEQAERTSTGRK